jgi:carboxymethylenebutenolidase
MNVQMKYLPLLLIVILSPIFSGCSPESKNDNEKDEMTEMAGEKKFQEAHEMPRDANVAGKGKMVRMHVRNEAPAYAYEIKPEGRARGVLYVIHEWWGLNDNIKAEAEKLYDELDGRVHVLALDLYDRKVADTREKAGEYMQNANPQRIHKIIEAGLNYVPRNLPVATIGWCFGGGWSLKAAIQSGKRGQACVLYYGMPVKSAAEISPLQAPVLGIFGSQDEWINPGVVSAFENLCKTTGKEFTYEMFDADHAFANPSSERYKQDAAQEANKIAVGFLKDKLGI